MVNPDRNLYDPPYDDALLYDNEMEPERPRSRPLIMMLGFVVLAAFAGVIWVAYNQGVQQGQRGVNPPLLSADSGPERVEPTEVTTATAESPAPEKSYERLWSNNGEGSTVQENVMPRGEQPREAPTTQDVAAAPAPGISANNANSGGPLVKAPPVDPRMDTTVDLTGEVASGSESSTSLTAPSLERPTRASRGREDITSMIPEAPSDVVEAPPPSVSRPSIKQTAPASKPSAPKAILPPVEAAADLSLQSAEVVEPQSPEASTPPTAGKASIQLGSFPSSKLAADQWTKVKGAHQELLGAYSPQIVEATIPGKGIWYRLRVGGFGDKSAAKSVCDQLQSSGQACIIAGK